MKKLAILLMGLLCGGAVMAEPDTAIFAGGCFWCMQPAFDKQAGVIYTEVGYTGGYTTNPTYEEVSGGKTGHVEAILVTYDPNQISYGKLLEIFWHNIDPFTENRQFCDVGTQYRAEIFYANEAQQSAAELSKAALQRDFDRTIMVLITPASTFYPAEEEHQEYYKKHPYRYQFYRRSCGRDARLKEIWGNEKGPL